MRTLVRSLTAAAVATTLLAPPALATEGTPAPSPTAVKEFRNTCDPAKATLPKEVEGAPTVQPGAPAGLYVWHDKKGWRIRYTHDLPKVGDPAKAQRVEVRGLVTSSRPISNVRLVKLEPKQRGEGVSVKRPGRKVLSFTFINYGGIDGVNFAAGCAGKLTFTAWTVTRDETGKLVRDQATGKVVRTPVKVFLGKTATEAVQEIPANPGLVAVPTGDVTKVRVLRTPPPVASPAPTA